MEHHHALINDAVVYPTLKVALGKMSSALLWMNHVKFPDSVEPSLEAPDTEFAIWDLHESTDADKFLDTLKELRATVYKDCPGEVFPGSAGPTVENPRKYIVCLGWHSIEVCPPQCAVPFPRMPNIVSLAIPSSDQEHTECDPLPRYTDLPGNT